MNWAECGALVTGAIGVAYFIGVNRGHALACTRIAYLAEREKLWIGDAVRAIDKLDRGLFKRRDFDADEIAFIRSMNDLASDEENKGE